MSFFFRLNSTLEKQTNGALNVVMVHIRGNLAILNNLQVKKKTMIAKKKVKRLIGKKDNI